MRAVPADELPVVLPDVKSYEPTGTGESPLAAITDWVRCTDPRTNEPLRRLGPKRRQSLAPVRVNPQEILEKTHRYSSRSTTMIGDVGSRSRSFESKPCVRADEKRRRRIDLSQHFFGPLLPRQIC